MYVIHLQLTSNHLTSGNKLPEGRQNVRFIFVSYHRIYLIDVCEIDNNISNMGNKTSFQSIASFKNYLGHKLHKNSSL